MTESETDWGCAALGRSGSVTVDVNETTSGQTRWELELDLPHLQLRFAIATSDAVAQFHDFLAAGDTDEFAIGLIANTEVVIVRDDEFDDRFFLTVCANDGAIHYAITGDCLTDLIAALAEAVSELND